MSKSKTIDEVDEIVRDLICGSCEYSNGGGYDWGCLREGGCFEQKKGGIEWLKREIKQVVCEEILERLPIISGNIYAREAIQQYAEGKD